MCIAASCPLDFQCPNIEPNCGELPQECAITGHVFECKMNECECVSLWYDNTEGNYVLNIRYEEYGNTCLPFDWSPVQFDCATIVGGTPCPAEQPLIDPAFGWWDEFTCSVTQEGFCRAFWEPKCFDSCPPPTSCEPAPPGTFGVDESGVAVETECIAQPCTCLAFELPVGCQLNCAPGELQCPELSLDQQNFWVREAINLGVPEELKTFECTKTDICSCTGELQPLWVLYNSGGP